jgi:hypothetical protein
LKFWGKIFIETFEFWTERQQWVETGPSRFAPLEMLILETGHSPPERRHPAWRVFQRWRWHADG